MTRGCRHSGSGGASLTLTNVTLTDNTAEGTEPASAVTSFDDKPAGGGGIRTEDLAEIAAVNTIIAGNQSPMDADCSGTLASSGSNLIGEQSELCEITGGPMGDLEGDSGLEALADNGGATQTHALQAGSQAIDAGDDMNCPETDQRGYGRPAGTSCDTGAFEFGATPPVQSLWGDDDCNGAVAATDALKNLQEIAAIAYTQTEPCFPIGDVVEVSPAGFGNYPWGDVDCNGSLASTDALGILRHLAGLPVNQEANCPGIGASVTVQ